MLSSLRVHMSFRSTKATFSLLPSPIFTSHSPQMFEAKGKLSLPSLFCFEHENLGGKI